MPRFFVQENDIVDGIVTLRGDDAHHIARSLRMAAGEHITICDPRGRQFDCVLSGFCDVVTASIVGELDARCESPVQIHLFQALVKGDKLDTVIQKAVECGAADITPRTISTIGVMKTALSYGRTLCLPARRIFSRTNSVLPLKKKLKTILSV